MKNSLSLLLITLAVSPLTQAAIHNGKVIDGKTYICSGTYIRHMLNWDRDYPRKISVAQCTFYGSTLTVQSPMFGGTGTLSSMTVNNPVYSSKSHQLDGYISKWFMTINWNSNTNNFNQKLFTTK
ncbi:MAG: hypothetical protein HAW67_07395 [Endozoicomonadaceae bacterium]|nr:hypothetical protein [Endozoicomonadaceae bacterium]